MKSKNINEIMVSIIVPVYNAEKYIRSTVKSICNQNFTNLEIILVDDGSSDSSGEIINFLASKDKRIKVIHQNNKGVSIARNVGMMQAQGDYIMFIDADDWVENDHVSYFVNMIYEDDYNIGIGETHFDRFNNYQSEKQNFEIVRSDKVIEWIYLNKVFMAVWNKIYKREFLLENNIWFNSDIWYGEGMLFNMRCLTLVTQVPFGHKRTYHYVDNPNSAMRLFNMDSEQCGIKSLQLQKKILETKSKTINNSYRYHLYSIYFNILCRIISNSVKSEHKNVYKDCIRYVRRHILDPLKVNIPLKKKAFYICVSITPVFMAIRNDKKIKNV